MRVFLDANVLFSASKAGSPIARLVDWLVEKGTAVTSDLACEEARRNLELKRPDWMAEFAVLQLTLEIVPTTVLKLPVPLSEKDVPVLSAAVAARCEYFATGDKRDFGALYGQKVLGTEIVSVLRLAELLASAEKGS